MCCVSKPRDEPPYLRVQVCPKQSTRTCTNVYDMQGTVAWAELWWSEQEKMAQSSVNGAKERLAALMASFRELQEK